MKTTKMTALKTNAQSTIISTARAIARETKEQARMLWSMTNPWRKILREHEADTQTLNENHARLQIVVKALETLKDDVLADLSAWSNAKDNDAVSTETERAAATAIYNGLKLIDYYLEIAKCMNPRYKLHHRALEYGYVRSGETEAKEYEGRFGRGLKLVFSNSDMTGAYARYHNISYYIEVA